MIVEIHGAGFQNKGAELMLRTTATELRDRVAGVQLAVDPTYGSFAERAPLGLHQLFPRRSHVGTPGFRRRFMAQRAVAAMQLHRALRWMSLDLDEYGAVPVSAVRGFVDIAGFAYSDQWGPRPCEDLAVLAAFYSRRRVPVILLPQAFGPFKNPRTRSAMREILTHATLVFPRDQQSSDYLSDLGVSTGNVSIAPDITLFSGGADRTPTTDRPAGPYACVVPNIRVLDRSDVSWTGKYLEALRAAIAELGARGISTAIVVHDASGDDRRLAAQLCASFESPSVTLVEEPDPTKLKAFVGAGVMLIGSRYHSIVAALSCRVPVIAIGWSHKYEMLMSDFGVGDYLIADPNTALGAIRERVAALCAADTHRHLRNQLDLRLTAFRPTAEQMWRSVGEALAQRGR